MIAPANSYYGNTWRHQMVQSFEAAAKRAKAQGLIAARVGGAFRGVGDSYLLESVGAVVAGGTLIAGGRSTSLGTLFGARFLVLVVTLVGVSRLSSGTQNIVEGAVIIVVLLAAGTGGGHLCGADRGERERPPSEVAGRAGSY